MVPRNIIYWVLGSGSLALMLFGGPSGAVLTSSPARGKVQVQPGQAPGQPTVRGGGPVFVWLGGGYGGGYHGGK